jgi:hypothetical protein
VDQIYLDKACPLQGAILLVLNDARSDIDREKTRLVTRHPAWKEQGQAVYRKPEPGESLLGEPLELAKRGLKLREDALHYANYSVFLYAGKTYFDLWWSAHPDYRGKPDYEAGRLRVFLAEGRQAREICVYSFEVDPAMRR